MVSAVFAMIALNERARGLKANILTASIVAVGLSYQVLTAERDGILLLLVTSILVEYIHSKRVQFKLILVSILLFMSVSIYNHAVLRKGIDSAHMTPSELVISVSHVLIGYPLGGLVSFDAIVQEPYRIPHTQKISLFFVHSLNKLGAHLDEPSRHAEFMEMGPGLHTNVYTCYFSYYAGGGFVGVVLCCAGLGFFMSFLYFRMTAGRGPATILFCFGVKGMMMGTLGDQFFMALNLWIKVALVSTLVYYVTTKRRQSTRLVHSSTALSPPKWPERLRGRT